MYKIKEQKEVKVFNQGLSGSQQALLSTTSHRTVHQELVSEPSFEPKSLYSLLKQQFL